MIRSSRRPSSVACECAQARPFYCKSTLTAFLRLYLPSNSYAYYQGYPQDQLPYINIPLHTLIKLTPKAYGCDEERCVHSSTGRSLRDQERLRLTLC